MSPLLRGLLQFGRQPGVAKSAVDVIRNPQTYRAISGQVDDVLKRILPGQFRGAGIQNAPTRLLGQVSDVSKMAPGAAKEAARNQVQRNFRMAGRLDDAVRPTGGQAASGALRAPTVPSPTRSFDRVMPRGARATSGPFRPNLNSTFQGPALPGGAPGAFQKLGDPGNIYRAITGTTALGKGVRGAAGLGLSMVDPTGLSSFGVAPIMSLMGLSGSTPRTGNEYNPGPLLNIGLDGSVKTRGKKSLREKQQSGEAPDPLKLREQYGGSGDMDGGPQPASMSDMPIPQAGDPSFDAFKAGGGNEALQRGVPLVDVVRQGQINLMNSQSQLIDDRNPAVQPSVRTVPPSAEENKGLTDPGYTQAAIYEKARIAAKTPDQVKAAERLGAALHRQANPALYNSAGIFQNVTDPYNPLMKSTFPDRYPQTREAYMKENGVQKPYSMTDASEREELREVYMAGVDDALLGLVDAETRVLDPNKFLQQQLSSRIIR